MGVEHEWVPGGELPLRQTELCGKTALLRRPFSLAGRGDDGRGAWIDIIHRVVGVGTDWLAGLQPGDAIDLIGPLGNHFPIPEDRSLALLVGGGVGLPPMFYLAEALHHAGHDAVGFIGAQMDDLLAVTRTNDCPPDPDGTPKPTVEEFSRFGYPTVITTDDGSAGLGGRITDGLTRYLDSQPTEDASRTIIYTCGPDPMMHAVAQVASRFGLECQVCLEQAMACGMGTCQSCVVRIEDHDHPHARTEDGKPWRYRLTCTDGPVFEAKKVLWG